MERLVFHLTVSLVSYLTVIGIIGLLYSKFNKSNKKFNWKAAFLAPWHYAQYGRWGLALLFGFAYGSFMALFWIITSIYTGIRADADLPKEKHKNAFLYMLLVSLWIVLVVYSQIRT